MMFYHGQQVRECVFIGSFWTFCFVFFRSEETLFLYLFSCSS
jgi:hypothetical protein